MTASETRKDRLKAPEYLLLAVPFILALASWLWFPLLTESLVKAAGYSPVFHTTSILWFGFVWFFYTWYTLLAIGVEGFFVVVAWFARRKKATQSPPKAAFYPMVSFVVPCFNEQERVERCVSSLFECASHYEGPCEIIIVDDGSTDMTYEAAWNAVKSGKRRHMRVRGKVVRHSSNLGKVEAMRSGMNCALGSLVAVVDGDSWWTPNTLTRLVDYMLANGKAAVTGYVHPTNGKHETNAYGALQQLEYSQGLGVYRCAQSFGNCVTVVPGAISIYRADVLRDVLTLHRPRSVTEDLEITLEFQKRGLGVGYLSEAFAGTVAPLNLSGFWRQRLRWFTGWLDNSLDVHRDLLFKRRWISAVLWFTLVTEYGGAFVDAAVIVAFPFLFWFAPDRIYFALNFLLFLAYALVVGVVFQAVALRFCYGKSNWGWLLAYSPFYYILKFLNGAARVAGSVRFLFFKDKGRWRNE